MKQTMLSVCLCFFTLAALAQNETGAVRISPEAGRAGSAASLSGGAISNPDTAPTSTIRTKSNSGYTEAYPTNLAMRTERRVGAGTQVGGISGLLGFHMELNFEDENAAWAGFGFGDGYSTFGLAWKHQFEGQFFTPYTNLGWSRWYNSAGSGKPKSYILDATLHGDEKESGRFGIDYIVAGGGLQFNQLDGDLQGASFFAELDLLLPPFRGGVTPTASVGATYFF